MTDIDLAAYLGRTGAAEETPSLAALTRLLHAHVTTFPFDTVDVLLGQHRGVDLDTVGAKFLDHHRGGYCFEHATLFHAVLLALGYDARLLLGRVGDPATAPRTHLAVVVTIDGVRHLCDPGIGVPPTAPIELRDGARVEGGIWPHEIRRVDEGSAGAAWQLWRVRSGGWEHMHTMDELQVREVDVAMGHHWTSTSPRSHFRRSLTLARHGVAADGTPVQVSVSTDTITERRAGEPSRQRPYAVEELPELLPLLGIRLDSPEATRLVERVRGLREGVR
ncbi:arylamine N-acetyltransferase family protein [Janibacter indicus]|uniref:arylamine N-acetyltransferase family protein n=1 Tax=Janibacter indicus TaxID=857417 RepID=UPI003EB9A780